MTETRTKPRICFYVDETMLTPDGYVPVAVTEGEPGYSPMTGNGSFAQPWYWGKDIATAKKICEESNADLGLTAEDVSEIIASSIGAQIRGDAMRDRAEERYAALHKGRLSIVEGVQEREGLHP